MDYGEYLFNYFAQPKASPVTCGEEEAVFDLQRQVVRETSRKTIQVPFGWSRVTVETSRSVYYLTPSGHVLLSPDDVLQYLKTKYTCKCYLDFSVKFEDVFNFDANIKEIQCLEWHGQKDMNNSCDAWMHTSMTQEEQNKLQLEAINYQMDHLVDDLETMYIQLTEGSKVAKDDVDLWQWLDTFNWMNIQLLDDGQLMSTDLTREQCTHFVHELFRSGKLSDPKKQELMPEQYLQNLSNSDMEFDVPNSNSRDLEEDEQSFLLFVPDSPSSGQFSNFENLTLETGDSLTFQVSSPLYQLLSSSDSLDVLPMECVSLEPSFLLDDEFIPLIPESTSTIHMPVNNMTQFCSTPNKLPQLSPKN